ncbi:MAG: thioredoxin domain-containing protein [Candidatus Peribacter sp.]|jgi:protein-disulfide isomerase|nr:thioredoxin domain-containing protein [Candidatus Peribacter sp.]MBT4392647.1 thioredoxin domain-containing protein [Candidatus Peribacter sp.]MBT4600736.1 thioredoxin domain-containing protein [Candidatus Peribacter sp.]MBT5148595.1 thioredoxin domain-containing protein [Candidatus Peribacter sp.]MBT5637809.1 thioredoxin domain-containing protein [Candidatus Peribacter sp.]
MKTPLTLLSLCLFLTACGEVEVSSRQPKGNPNASVLVEEFADLQCPACAAAHSRIVEPLLDKYGTEIRFEHKHFPLRSIHRFALDASEMSECAADQGKYWEYIDIAFTNQSDLSLDSIVEWAEALGLDADKAERCWKSHSKRDTVLADYKEGREREINGTPSFFVNGVRVETGFDTLSEAIDKALEGTMMRL